MHEYTGEIVEMSEAQKRADADKFIPIPNDELASVQSMNRHHRRAWAARKRSQERALSR